MTPAMPRAKRIDLLLQAALTERHVRRPLLAELVDELVDAGQYPEAAQAGRALLARLDAGIDGPEYVRLLGQLIELIGRTRSKGMA